MTGIAELIEESGAIKRGEFELSDGSLTDYYIDKYSFETTPELLSSVTDALTANISVDDTDLIAGPALGAVPLVTAVSLQTGIPAAYVRTNDNTQTRVEGSIREGQRVTILEDVTTTGGTILDSAEVIEEMGGTVEQLLAVVDRNEGAVSNVKSAGYELEYLVQVDRDFEITDE